jgi:two-component system sensor histidine kinase UhpB
MAATATSGEPYRTLVELLPDAVVVHREGVVVFANQAAARLIGAGGADQLVGKPVLGYVAPQDKPAAAQRIRTMLESGEPVSPRVETFVRLDGSRVPVEVRASPVVLDGRLSVLVVARDISERVEAEKAVRDTERRYREVVDLAPVGIYQSVRSGELLMANRRLAEILGFESADELVQRSMESLYYDPLDRARFIEKYEPSGTVSDLELRWRRKDGTPIWIHLDAHAVKDRDGRTRYYEGFVRDISERKRAEEALRVSEEKFARAFRSSPHANTIARLADGMLVDVNDGFCRVLGFRRADVLGRTIPEIGLFVSDAEREAFERRIKERGWVRDFVVRMRTWAGEERLFRLSGERIEIAGEPHVVALSADITEERRAEEALRESREQLRKLAQRLEEVREAERAYVAREIHDELGQTLTALNIDLTLLKNRVPPGEGALRQRADEMVTLVERMIGTVRRIATELRPGVLDDMGLTAAVEWVVQDFQERTELDCRLSIVGGERAVPPGPGVAMFRILQEALTNVARHAGASIVTIMLDLSSAVGHLEVRDDGRGLGEPTGSRPALGLLGMRERAMAFGGAVTVESASGGGTLVRAVIPLGGGGDR